MGYISSISIDSHHKIISIMSENDLVDEAQIQKDIEIYGKLPKFQEGDTFIDKRNRDKYSVDSIRYIHDLNGYTGYAYYMNSLSYKYTYMPLISESMVSDKYIYAKGEDSNVTKVITEIKLEPKDGGKYKMTFNELLTLMQEELEYYKDNYPKEVENLLNSEIKLAVHDDRDFECSCNMIQFAGFMEGLGTTLVAEITSVDFEN